MVHAVDDCVLVFAPGEEVRGLELAGVVRIVRGWIESRGELRGVVIHTHELPGWQDLAYVVRHPRGLRAYRNRIHRIALATNSRLLGAGMRIAEVLVAAEIKQFVYAALDGAVRWAARGTLAAPVELSP